MRIVLQMGADEPEKTFDILRRYSCWEFDREFVGWYANNHSARETTSLILELVREFRALSKSCSQFEELETLNRELGELFAADFGEEKSNA